MGNCVLTKLPLSTLLFAGYGVKLLEFLFFFIKKLVTHHVIIKFELFLPMRETNGSIIIFLKPNISFKTFNMNVELYIYLPYLDSIEHIIF